MKRISGEIHFECPSVEDDGYSASEALKELLRLHGWDIHQLTMTFEREKEPA